MNLNRIKAIAKKEFKHLLRDYRMLAILVLFPVFLLGIFGYAINFDVHHIKLAVYDQEYSDVTRDLVKGLINSEYFDLSGYLKNDKQLKTTLDNKLAVYDQEYSDVTRDLVKGLINSEYFDLSGY